MKILAIETSCDETAMVIVETKGGLKNPRFKILENIVSSQIKIHRPFGGVVPNLAKREHLKNLPIILKKLQAAGFRLQDIDLIAVTIGPGLEPALYTGVNFAKDLAEKWKKPIIGVNHLEGHLYSFLLEQKRIDSKFPAYAEASAGRQIPNSKFFPAIALIVSGGHTILLLMKDLIHRKKLGETRDDAVGEAFDKIAKMLGLPYPGGPELEKLAIYGGSTSIDFPRPMLNQKNYDFSFSGLKTAVLYYLKDNKFQTSGFKFQENVAASFQQAAFEVLIKKTIRATKEFKAKSIILTGGVAANKELHKQFTKAIKIHNSIFMLQVPSLKFCTDNAAMIAAAAYINWVSNKKRSARVNSNLGL